MSDLEWSFVMINGEKKSEALRVSLSERLATSPLRAETGLQSLLLLHDQCMLRSDC